ADAGKYEVRDLPSFPPRRTSYFVISMRTLKLSLAYDGTNYVGWQRQTNGVSVQQLVEDALAPLAGRVPGPGIAGAGRTDAGVHALAQVASVNVDFDVPADAVHRAL